jgi:diaminopimelate decarboxylase
MSADTRRESVSQNLRLGAKRALSGLVRTLGPLRRDFPLVTWRLTRPASGALTLDGVTLEALLGHGASPLHVVDATALAANAKRFLATPTSATRGCEVFYSYKTDPVPGVLRHLHAHGLGAEVASDYELWLALHLGVDPRKVIFNGPTRSAGSLALAVRIGVELINLNGRGEIGPLAALAAGSGKRANVGIRVVPPGSVGGQFGERIDTGEALATFREAHQRPELRVVALHAHNNAEITTLDQLDGFLSSLLAFTDVLRAQAGIELEILDVGGNLACPTVTPLSARARQLAVTFGSEPVPRLPSSVLSIDAYVGRVLERVGAHYASRSRPPPRIFLEPGRAVTSNAQMLLCRVIRVRDADANGVRWVVLDGGHNVAEPVTSEIHQIVPLMARPNPERRLYRLTGPNCTLGDQLYPAWEMPEVFAGDGLAIMDSGAYFISFSTCFSRPRAGVVMINQGQVESLRRAETFDDLVSLDDLQCSPPTRLFRSLASVPEDRAMQVARE